VASTYGYRITELRDLMERVDLHLTCKESRYSLRMGLLSYFPDI